MRERIVYGVNRHTDGTYDDLCDLISTVYNARIRITGDSTGLTKDEITYFNKMIKEHKIEIKD